MIRLYKMEHIYLYCISNEAMPGIFKVIISDLSPCLILNQANILDPWRPPNAYRIVFAKQVANRTQSDHLIYTLLYEYTERLTQNGGFFRVDVETIKSFFDMIEGEVYIHDPYKEVYNTHHIMDRLCVIHSLMVVKKATLPSGWINEPSEPQGLLFTDENIHFSQQTPRCCNMSVYDHEVTSNTHTNHGWFIILRPIRSLDIYNTHQVTDMYINVLYTRDNLYIIPSIIPPTYKEWFVTEHELYILTRPKLKDAFISMALEYGGEFGEYTDYYSNSTDM